MPATSSGGCTPARLDADRAKPHRRFVPGRCHSVISGVLSVDNRVRCAANFFIDVAPNRIGQFDSSVREDSNGIPPTVIMIVQVKHFGITVFADHVTMDVLRIDAAVRTDKRAKLAVSRVVPEPKTRPAGTPVSAAKRAARCGHHIDRIAGDDDRGVRSRFQCRCTISWKTAALRWSKCSRLSPLPPHACAEHDCLAIGEVRIAARSDRSERAAMRTLPIARPSCSARRGAEAGRKSAAFAPMQCRCLPRDRSSGTEICSGRRDHRRQQPGRCHDCTLPHALPPRQECRPAASLVRARPWIRCVFARFSVRTAASIRSTFMVT